MGATMKNNNRITALEQAAYFVFIILIGLNKKKNRA